MKPSIPVSVRAGIGARRHRRRRACAERAALAREASIRARVLLVRVLLEGKEERFAARVAVDPSLIRQPIGPWQLFVWHELQRVPATAYGKARCPEGFVITVDRDPSIRTDLARRIVRYHFA